MVQVEHVREIRDLFKEIVFLRINEAKEEAVVRRGGPSQVDRNDVSMLSVPKQTKIFIEVLNDEARNKNPKTFTMTELKEIAKSMKLKVGEFYSFIEKLNFECLLIQRSTDTYALLGEYG